MSQPCKILILGASYGSLLGIKLVMAGHQVTLVCLPHEVELINREGIRVRLPLKGRDGLVELDSRRYPGQLLAAGPADVKPADYDPAAVLAAEAEAQAIAGLPVDVGLDIRMIDVDHHHLGRAPRGATRLDRPRRAVAAREGGLDVAQRLEVSGTAGRQFQGGCSGSARTRCFGGGRIQL